MQARATAPLTREDPHPRQRAPGAGRKWELDPATRLLAALVWRKLYPAWAVLGFLFGVEESATRRSTKDVLARLQSLAIFPLEQRSRRSPGKDLVTLIEAYPVVEVIVGSHEQTTRRPKSGTSRSPSTRARRRRTR